MDQHEFSKLLFAGLKVAVSDVDALWDWHEIGTCMLRLGINVSQRESVGVVIHVNREDVEQRPRVVIARLVERASKWARTVRGIVPWSGFPVGCCDECGHRLIAHDAQGCAIKGCMCQKKPVEVR